MQTISPQEEVTATRPETNKGFKLDLDNVKKLGHMGYHEEFYSKLD